MNFDQNLLKKKRFFFYRIWTLNVYLFIYFSWHATLVFIIIIIIIIILNKTVSHIYIFNPFVTTRIKMIQDKMLRSKLTHLKR